MPRISDRIPINNPALDGRVKLLSPDKDQIRLLYRRHEYSQRELARMYGVSRRLICFTIYPERMKPTDWKKYYDRQRHARYTRKHRDKKKTLYAKGLI